MANTLFDKSGQRKYLVARERLAFVATAAKEDALVSAFCLTLAFTGARISEALALTSDRIDVGYEALVFQTLKQRKKLVFRAVVIPRALIQRLRVLCPQPSSKLWPWGRTTAWKITKAVMRDAGIVEGLCKPKALRHAFAVEAVLQGVPLNIIQRWLGHARLETTAIYACVMGEEERSLARRSWGTLESVIVPEKND